MIVLPRSAIVREQNSEGLAGQHLAITATSLLASGHAGGFARTSQEASPDVAILVTNNTITADTRAIDGRSVTGSAIELTVTMNTTRSVVALDGTRFDQDSTGRGRRFTRCKTFVDFLVNRYGKGYGWAHTKGDQG